jgi:hypothetical protein
MDERINEYVDAVVEMEWSQFADVKNIGGRAACQDDPATFDIMRRSQFLTWDEHSLESYLDDLFLAVSSGENIVAHKYAYMMAYSLPEEFERISARLPHVSIEKYELARKLTNQHLKWHREVAEAYPKLAGRGRTELMVDEAGGDVSFENYTLGEFLSMSLRTLKRYDTHMEKLAHEGMNMALMTMENMVLLYGYPSIEDAENEL